VYCAESVDLPNGHDIDMLEVDPSLPPRDEDGAVVVTGRLLQAEDRGWPYVAADDTAESGAETTEVALHPYHDWGNRGPATMRVWLPVNRNITDGRGTP
jgi:uncharacterized protein